MPARPGGLLARRVAVMLPRPEDVLARPGERRPDEAGRAPEPGAMVATTPTSVSTTAAPATPAQPRAVRRLLQGLERKPENKRPRLLRRRRIATPFMWGNSQPRRYVDIRHKGTMVGCVAINGDGPARARALRPGGDPPRSPGGLACLR